jgi:hypothetical protein
MCCMRGCDGCPTYARIKRNRPTYILSRVGEGDCTSYVIWQFKRVPFKPSPRHIVTVAYSQSKAAIMYAAKHRHN